MSETPSEGNEILVEYTIRTNKGVILDTTKQRTPFSFILGEKSTYSELESAVKTMKKGENKVINISKEHSLEIMKKYAENPSEINDSEELELELNLIDFHPKIKSKFEMDISEKIKESKKLKEEGTLEYKQQKYKEALDKYEESLKYIEKIPEKDINEDLVILKKSLMLNCCNCCNKLKDFYKTIKIALNVINIDNKNPKAYYYKCFANVSLCEFEDAKNDYQKLVEYMGNENDPGVINLKNLIKDKEHEKNLKDKNKMKSFLKKGIYDDK